jgi:hypothetical protein
MIYSDTNRNPVDVEGGVDERGLATVTVTYFAPDEETKWKVADDSWDNLKRISRKFKRRSGGGYDVIAIFQGKDPNAREDDLFTFECDSTLSEKPIEVHPKFEVLKNTYGWQALSDGTVGFPEKAPQAAKADVGEDRGSISPVYGLTTWLDIGIVWRKSWVVGGDIPEEEARRLGRIAEPDGKIPQVDSDRNWLKTAVRIRGRGNSWEITVEWTLSGRGGWIPEIYEE